MPDQTMTQTQQRDQATGDPSRSAPAAPPIEEIAQPDPALAITSGRVGPIGVTLLAVVVAFILGVFFYGLNSGGTGERTAAVSAPPPAAHSSKPAAGGKPGPAMQSGPHANPAGVKG
jgi:hypothetical protein